MKDADGTITRSCFRETAGEAIVPRKEGDRVARPVSVEVYERWQSYQICTDEIERTEREICIPKFMLKGS